MAEEEGPNICKRLRDATKTVHDSSDKLVNLKLGVALSEPNVWYQGLLVFSKIFFKLESCLDQCPSLEELDLGGLRRWLLNWFEVKIAIFVTASEVETHLRKWGRREEVTFFSWNGIFELIFSFEHKNFQDKSLWARFRLFLWSEMEKRKWQRSCSKIYWSFGPAGQRRTTFINCIFLSPVHGTFIWWTDFIQKEIFIWKQRW